jgi:hypothetical protein
MASGYGAGELLGLGRRDCRRGHEACAQRGAARLDEGHGPRGRRRDTRHRVKWWRGRRGRRGPALWLSRDARRVRWLWQRPRRGCRGVASIAGAVAPAWIDAVVLVAQLAVSVGFEDVVLASSGPRGAAGTFALLFDCDRCEKLDNARRRRPVWHWRVDWRGRWRRGRRLCGHPRRRRYFLREPWRLYGRVRK